MTTTALGVCVARLACDRTIATVFAAALTLTSAASAQTVVDFDTNKPNPDRTDKVRLQSEALHRPPYSDAKGRYELRVYYCENDCGNPANWKRFEATDDNGDYLRPARFYACKANVDKDRCAVWVRLHRPRDVAYTFIGAVFDTVANKTVAQSKRLVVTWKGDPVAMPKTPDHTPSLTLTVNGETCRAEHGKGPGGSNWCFGKNKVWIQLQKDMSGPAPTVKAELKGFPSSWNKIIIGWLSISYTCENATVCAPTLPAEPRGFHGNGSGLTAQLDYDKARGKEGVESLAASIDVDFRRAP